MYTILNHLSPSVVVDVVDVVAVVVVVAVVFVAAAVVD